MGVVGVLTPFRHVNVLPNPIFCFCKSVNYLFINFNFYRKINLFVAQSHLNKRIGGDSIVMFLVFQVERETIMTA